MPCSAAEVRYNPSEIYLRFPPVSSLRCHRVPKTWRETDGVVVRPIDNEATLGSPRGSAHGRPKSQKVEMGVRERQGRRSFFSVLALVRADFMCRVRPWLQSMPCLLSRSCRLELVTCHLTVFFVLGGQEAV